MPEPRHASLDPFAFPEATGDRFALFALVVLLASSCVGGFLNLVLGKVWNGTTAALAQVACPTLVLGGGVVLYLLHPRRYALRWRLLPLADVRDPVLVQRVEALAARAGMGRVRFMIAPDLHRQGGQAFGFPWRPRVRLDSGLRLVLRKRPDLFDAVVTHELAHIANGDLAYAYLARAWLQSFALLAGALAAIDVTWAVVVIVRHFLPGHQRGESLLPHVWDLLYVLALPFALVPVIALLMIEYGRLLRLREHFADWRTAALLRGPEAAGFGELLGRYEAPRPAGLSRLLPLSRLHPDPSERALAVADPRAILDLSRLDLFLMSLQLAFLVTAAFGTTAAFTGTTGVSVPEILWVNSLAGLWLFVLAGCLIRHFLVRPAPPARDVRGACATAVGHGLALASGLLVGMLLWPISPIFWLFLLGGGPSAPAALAQIGLWSLASVLVGAGLGAATLPLRLALAFLIRRWRRPSRPRGLMVVLRLSFGYWALLVGQLWFAAGALAHLIDLTALSPNLPAAPLPLALGTAGFLLVSLLACLAVIFVATLRRPSTRAGAGALAWPHHPAVGGLTPARPSSS